MSTQSPAEYIGQARPTEAGTFARLCQDTVTRLSPVICGSMLLLADATALYVSVLLSYIASLILFRGVLQTGMDSFSVWHSAGTLRLLLIFAGVSCYLQGRGHFRDRLPFWHELRDLVVVGIFAVCAGLALSLVSRDRPQGFMLSVAWLAFPCLAIILRQAAKLVLSRAGLWRIPVLIVGDRPNVADAARLLSLEAVPGYQVVGSLPPSLTLGASFSERCIDALRIHGAKRLILSCDPGTEMDDAIMQSIVRARIPFSVLPQSTALPVLGCTRMPFFSHDAVMLSYRDNLAQPAARGIKVAFDVIVSATILAMLSPVFFVLALLTRRDGGRSLFGHRRVGTNKRDFHCLKFRTMVVNSADVLRDLLARDIAAAKEWEDTQKLTDDPRVTSIGKFLRATSLDELPQLLNILRLEMSLVGPRPIVEQEVIRYDDDIAYYDKVRPGLTGLWQVSGRSDTSYKQRVQLDCWYVRNWSLWHDTAILLKTVPAVLKRQGAR